MPITVPADGVIISAPNFGVPVANRINAFAMASAVGVGGSSAAGATIATIGIPASAVDRMLMLTYHALVGHTGESDIQLRVNGVVQLAYRMIGTLSQETISLTYLNYRQTANTTLTLTAYATAAVTTYSDGTVNNLGWLAIPVA